MKALSGTAKKTFVATGPDPEIEQPRDAIIKVTSCAICGSDLHLYEVHSGHEKGDIMGHEFMGEVVEVGRQKGSSRLATGSSYPSPSSAASASSADTAIARSASGPIGTRTPTRCSATRPPGFSVTRI